MGLATLRSPEYTGENRCMPCTALNLVIAAALAVAVGVVFVPAGAAVLAMSLVVIYLRGYLVPGTPTLTKRYLPERVLAWFDKADHPVAGRPGGATVGAERAERADADGEDSPGANETEPVAPETLLADAGVVEEDPSTDDLRFTAAFADDWQAAVDLLRADEAEREQAAAALFDPEAVRLDTNSRGQRTAHAADAEEAWRLGVWPSEGALIADLAATSTLAEWVAEWDDVSPQQRAGIAEALRSFMPACPLCGGTVEMTEETVESCCRSHDVLAVRCGDCEEHYLELDPERVRAAGAGDAP